MSQQTVRGNLLIGQSGGPTAVINASLVGAVKEALRIDAIDTVYGAIHGVEGLLNRKVIDIGHETSETLQTIMQTPSAYLGSCRYKLREDDPEKAAEILKAHNVRYFLYIGGNDSADTAHRIGAAATAMGYDLRVIGVPKTIDNDLPVTDHCPGYGSAARAIAMATQESALCSQAMPEHYPVKIIEVMGRYAGWLACASSLGKHTPDDAPHLIYIPERKLDYTAFLRDVRNVVRRVGYCVAVVSEHLTDMQGKGVGEQYTQGTDAFGHPLVAGVAQTLVDLVNSELGLRARFDKPGDWQRMSSAHFSKTDVDEAYLVGRMAVRYAVRGVTQKMVTLQRVPGERYACETGLADLEEIANQQKVLPDEFLDKDGAMVSQAFYDYALPLIGAPLPSYARVQPRYVW